MKKTLLCILALTCAIAAHGEITFVKGFNSGGTRYIDAYGHDFATDLPYEPGGSGYEGGVVSTPVKVLYSAPWSTDDADLHLKQRRLINAYRFEVPDGDYMLRLYFLDGLKHGPRLRLLDVEVEGQIIYDDLDIVDEVNFMGALETSHLVTVSDGRLDVEISADRYETTISAIGVWSAEMPAIAPSAPDSLGYRDSYGMNILRWAQMHDYSLKDVIIHRAESAEGPWDSLATRPCSRRRYYDKDALPGQPYWYRIKVRDIWGQDSEWTTGDSSVVALHWSESDLPVVHLHMDQDNYDSLNVRPLDDEYFDAYWAADSSSWQDVEARYRGGLGRYFEKKSWKIKLPSDETYNGYNHLHLVASPDDAYVIRNHVNLRIFDNLRPWSSATDWVHLEQMGEYRGLFDLIEEVDEDFFSRRNVRTIGNTYKAYSNFGLLAGEAGYRMLYDKKTGPDDSYDDLIDLVENVHYMDDFDFRNWIAGVFDFEKFYDYYAMIIFTRNYDFVERNYYLYHSADSGLWSIIPWDMTLSYYWEMLPLDFGSANSPHWWSGGVYNHLIDRLITIPRVRYEYAKRFDFLIQSHTMSLDGLWPIVNSCYSEVEFDGDRDVYKPLNDLNTWFDIAAEYLWWRLFEREEWVIPELPLFMAEIPTVVINELQPGGMVPVGFESNRNEISPWIELYNFGTEPVALENLRLRDGDGFDWDLPAIELGPEQQIVFYLDGMPQLGVLHSDLVADREGGELTLLGSSEEVWDHVRYDAYRQTKSQGRSPDGWLDWISLPPTPGAANTALRPPIISNAELLPAQPLAADSLHVDVDVRHLGHGDEPNLALYFVMSLAGGAEDSIPMLMGESADNWYLDLPPLGSGGVLEWWIGAIDLDTEAGSTSPPGVPYYKNRIMIIDDSLPLFINEFMADNETVISDEFGAYEDWVEIYNSSDVSVDLAGMTLTDNLTTPDKWTFPDDDLCVIEPGGFLLVWTDGDDEEGPLHTNFKLSKEGEDLGLFFANGQPVDFLTFGTQQEDISYGRTEDGGDTWDFLPLPSPGASNNREIAAGGAPFLGAWPNPFNPDTRFVFALPAEQKVSLIIYDVSGRRVKVLVDGVLEEGSHDVRWRGEDDAGQACAGGIYLARLQGEGSVTVRKVLLLK